MNLTSLRAWATQPSTLLCVACLIGAATYWMTNSAPAALTAASVIPGVINDRTKVLLDRIETLEAAIKEARKIV